MPTIHPWDQSAALLAYTRTGFENDAAAELTERTAEAGLAGYCRTHAGTGLVELHSDVRGRHDPAIAPE